MVDFKNNPPHFEEDVIVSDDDRRALRRLFKVGDKNAFGEYGQQLGHQLMLAAGCNIGLAHELVGPVDEIIIELNGGVTGLHGAFILGFKDAVDTLDQGVEA